MAADTSPSPPLVDTHAHVFLRRLPFTPNAVHSFDRDYPTEAFVSELDAAGVKYAAIAAASFLGNHVDYTLEALAAQSRLRATVNADPNADPGRLKELDCAGVVGIRLAVGNLATAPDLTEPRFQRMLTRAAELDWHVHVYSRREQLPPMVDALLQSGVKIVLDHFGARDNQSGPGAESFQSVIRALKSGRAWIKLSGPYLSPALDHTDLATRFLDAGGSERLLWGSDWPFVAAGGSVRYCDAVKWLSDWMPDPAIRAQIDRNALSLYRFPAE
ncbi:MAG: amidohydrolase family protein [Mesorhizobium sp.]|nr:amidohydrolase family protein [Mesorhizobium sp.]